MSDQVDIRALQQNASTVVQRAAAGEVTVITDRGRPVARVVPMAASPLQQLLDEGRARVTYDERLAEACAWHGLQVIAPV